MVGQTISHYKILAKLGEGGMGVVYKAQDTRLERPVALKFLTLHVSAGADEKSRFEREARAAAPLDHPNICTVYEIDEAEGRTFIAMAFLEGDTVQQLVEKGPLPVDDVLELGIQAAKGLAAAHEKGIVHRDIKSANLMVVRATTGSEPQLKIMDFGLAQLETGASKLTAEGSKLGTAAYMSPEQARGDKVDQRSDVWSLGVVLYEILTGRMPFGGEYQQAIIYSILHEEPVPVTGLRSGVDLELERIVFKALQKDVDDRYQSTLDLLVDLRSLKKRRDSGASRVEPPSYVRAAMPAAASAVTAPPAGASAAGADSGETPPAGIPQRRYGLPGAVAVVLVLFGAVAVWRWSADSPRALSDPPRVTPITSNAGTETFATFSPDGSQVAFVWDGPNQDNPDVYVRFVEGGQPLRLTTSPAPETGPVWSPDGRWIAFVRHERRRSAVYLVPPIGGVERKVADVRLRGQDRANRYLGWSPSGKTLAIAQQAGPPPSPPDRRGAAGERKGAVRGGESRGAGVIGLYRVGSGQMQQIFVGTTPGEARQRLHSPTFSPDGKRIAFVRTVGLLAEDIYVTALDGNGTFRRVTHDESRIQGLAWTEDDFLIFSSDRGGAGRLWKTRPGPAGGPILPLLGAGENAQLPSVARQGRRLAYTRAERDLNIWRRDVGHGPEMMEPRAVVASTRMDHSPQFSPDGKRIAFVSDRTGNSELWVSDSDVTNALKLTSYGGAIITGPSWSPDGREIAFQVIEGRRSEIDVVAADGASPRRLTTDSGGGAMPFWSRDGEWIYMNQREIGLCKIPARGGAQTEPLVVAQEGSFAQESRDGKLLYFSKRGFGGGLWSMPVDGGTPKALPREVMPAGRGRWVVTDRGIFFVDRERNLKLYHIDTDELETVVALEPEAIDVSGPGFSVSPDGMYFLYVRVDRSEADLMLVENYR